MINKKRTISELKPTEICHQSKVRVNSSGVPHFMMPTLLSYKRLEEIMKESET